MDEPPPSNDLANASQTGPSTRAPVAQSKPKKGFAFASPLVGLLVLILSIILASNFEGAEDPVVLIGYALALGVWIPGLVLGIRKLQKRNSQTQRRFWLLLIPISLNMLFVGIGLTALSLFAWLTINTALDQKKSAEGEAEELAAKGHDPQKAQEILVSRAADSYRRHFQELKRNYVDLGRAMTNPPVLILSHIKSLEDLKERRALVAEYESASVALHDFNRNPAEGFAEELSKHKITKEARKRALAQFHESPGKEIYSRIASIGNADLRRIRTTAKILKFLEENWEKWEFNTAKNEILFSEQRKLDTYLRLRGEVENLSSHVIQLQTNLRQFIDDSTNSTQHKVIE